MIRKYLYGGPGYFSPSRLPNKNDKYDYLNKSESIRSKVSTAIMNLAWIGKLHPSAFADSELTRDGGVPLRTYLLDREEQRKEFLKAGYIEGKEGDYGLVRKAVGNRDIPIYQREPDAANREDLEPIGNINSSYYPIKGRLFHAGGFPTTLYYNYQNGKLYLKAWDLNDYSGNTGTAKNYKFLLNLGATLLDKIGSPTVITSGFLEIPEDVFHFNYDKLSPYLKNFYKSKGLDYNVSEGPHLPEIVVTNKLKKYAGGGYIKENNNYINGYVRDLNNHPISFDTEGNLVDLVSGEKGIMMLPGFTVTGISPETKAKNYSTSFDGTYGLTPRDVYGMIPVVGDALDVKDIGTDLYNRDYINAGIGTGLFLLPNVIEKPFKFAKSLYKKRSIISKINKELEKGIKENSILESYNKIPANKDIGTAYNYLDFLDNIYPNSKLNATFYHGGPNGITQFKSAKELGSTNKGINSGTKDYGIYVADDKSLALYYANTHKKANRHIYNVRVNAQNPMRYETNNWYMDKFDGTGDLRFRPGEITLKWYDRLNLKNYDGIYHTKSKNALDDGELVMFDGNNIHIMGTPEESLMFRSWKLNPLYSSKPLLEEIPLTPELYDRSFLNYAKASKAGLTLTGILTTPLLPVLYDIYLKPKTAKTRKSKAAKKRSSSKINRKETSHNVDNTTQFGITNYGFKK